MSFGELLAQLLGWLGDFIQFIISFCPKIVIIRCTEQGIKFPAGNPAEAMPPGIHWVWPWRTKVMIHDVTRYTLQVEPLPLETSDGIQVEIGLVISYRIIDILLYEAQNFAPEDNISATAEGELCAIVRDHAWAELVMRSEEGSRLEKKLRGRMSKALDKFGIEVENCRPSSQIRLQGATHLFGVRLLPPNR